MLQNGRAAGAQAATTKALRLAGRLALLVSRVRKFNGTYVRMPGQNLFSNHPVANSK